MTTAIKDIICQLLEWTKYKIGAHYRRGQGIPSPFVFELVSKVFVDTKEYGEYRLIEDKVKELYSNDNAISFKELGGGSRRLGDTKRKVSDIVRHSSVNKKYGRLIYRMVQYYKPQTILEIGTSLGVSTMYMALANRNTVIHTIEGNESVGSLAKKLAAELRLDNIEFHFGLFDEVLPDLSDRISPSLFFIDGNHTYESTIRYFNLVKSHMREGFIIIDDIYWSYGMRKAWKEIRNSNTTTIDIFEMGIVVIKETLTEEKYRIRF